MEHLISEKLLYQAILSGAEQTRGKREELNRINVFPVVDNDTGNNLAHTMQHILANASLLGSVRQTLLEISRSAIYGARGNSGAIFSQYLNGLYENSAEKEAVSLSELSDYFQTAYQKAYAALDVPVEGTIITLMRTWAASMAKLKDRESSLLEIFEEALKDVRQSLRETTKTLQVLKDLHIVDAGALGFYAFIEGFVKVITGQHQYIHTRTTTASADVDAPDIHASGGDAEFPYRYCTEVLLEIAVEQAALLKEELRTLGDSLLLCGSEDIARIHLHTNEPWAVIRKAASRGKILEHKVDDMVFQHRMASGIDRRIQLRRQAHSRWRISVSEYGQGILSAAEHASGR
jgi:dihydroxyacetone kinase-like predicted kinase